MRNISFLFLIALLASCGTANKSTTVMFASNKTVAHRGAFKKNGFPENSIASLKEAIRLGCAGSEFDVRMSLDDTLLINHDPHYNKLDIEKATYAQLAAAKLSNGETIPTLREYLLAGLEGNKKTRLVVEVKPSATKERGRTIAEKTVALIRQLKAESMVVYISFDYDILKKIIELNPKASTQYLNGDISPDRIKADGISGLDYHISVFKKNPQWIDSAKGLNLALNAWTVNSEEEMHWLLERGFDFITSNEPELLLSITQKEK